MYKSTNIVTYLFCKKVNSQINNIKKYSQNNGEQPRKETILLYMYYFPGIVFISVLWNHKSSTILE